MLVFRKILLMYQMDDLEEKINENTKCWQNFSQIWGQALMLYSFSIKFKMNRFQVYV